jgi:hypothetical protein
MKRFLVVLLLMFIISSANAQVYRMFMKDDGKQTDSAKANSYIIIKKLSDTSWLMQNYDMQNRIMQAGTYKDRNLQIPNGKFVYCDRLNTYNMSKAVLRVGNVDTAIFLRTYGEFKNGKKDGWWIDYVRNGHQEITYSTTKLNQLKYS